MNTLNQLEAELNNAELALQKNVLVYKHQRLLKQYTLAWKAVEAYKSALEAQAEVAAYAKELDELDEQAFDLPYEYSSTPDYEVLALCAKYNV